MERKSVGDVRWLQSTLLDNSVFVHGFPERTGGVSTGPQASLNLRDRLSADSPLVKRNEENLGNAAGFDRRKLVATRHVHGTDVWIVGTPSLVPNEFDGMVSTEPGTVLGAYAADCLPVLFGDAQNRVCGAAHSGWRGTVNKIGPNVITSMLACGAKRENIRVAIGPSIGPCCFEVGEEVAEQFEKAFPNVELVHRNQPKPHVDLKAAMKAQLVDCGLSDAQIDSDSPCTKCEAERFFSYRREGAGGGVHMGFISLRSS